MLENIKVLLYKMGTVVADRRLWVSLLTVGVLMGVLPNTVDPEVKADELVAAVLAIVQGVGVLVTMVTLIIQWTKRPPSGKNYNLLPEVIAASTAIMHEVKAAKRS